MSEYRIRRVYVYCLLFIVYCLLFIDSCVLFYVYLSLFIFDCLLSIVYFCYILILFHYLQLYYVVSITRRGLAFNEFVDTGILIMAMLPQASRN